MCTQSAFNMETLIESIMLSAPKLLLSVAITLLASGLWKILVSVYRRRVTPLRLIPGPPSTHWFYGNRGEIEEAVSDHFHLQIINTYHLFSREMLSSMKPGKPYMDKLLCSAGFSTSVPSRSAIGRLFI